MEKPKKISKKAQRMAKKLEGVLMIRTGLYTVSLTEEEIYILLTEKKLIVEDGEYKCQVHIE